MKKILLLGVVLISLISCKETPNTQPTQPEVKYVPKYKSGELVYVGKDAFIVNYYDHYDGLYRLKKIDCKSDNCYYYILEGEITKTLEEPTYK